MYTRISLGIMALAAIASAQTYPRRAAVIGGGSPNNGQCTVEVVVDGVSEVEVHGANATLRNLSGQPPQWRRFECTSIMPDNPANFRFDGVDGRGKQQLVRDPRNGGSAVVRIEDSSGGSEGYTFRLTWGGIPGGRDDRGYDRGGSPPDRDRGYPDQYRGQPGPDSYYRDRDAWFRGNDWRANFFQRIRQDLDHATSGAFPFTGDRARLDRTRMELDQLQQKLSRGIYDERELDDVTRAMQGVLRANRLAPDDRAMLADDMNRLRDFRDRHDRYGAR